VAAAWRGRLEQESLEQLVMLSEHLGWNAQLFDDLSLALEGLARSGTDEKTAELAALALGLAVRHCIRQETDESQDGAESDDDIRPLMGIAIEVAQWILADPAGAAHLRKRLLTTTIEDLTGAQLALEIGVS
jgi:hypothetical protein